MDRSPTLPPEPATTEPSPAPSSDRLTVAFVIDTLQQPAGGTEGQLLHLLEGIDRRHFDPVVVCLRDNEWLRAGRCPARVHVLDLHLRRHPDVLSGIWRFSRWLRREGVDVVQTHFRDANLVGVLAARWAGIDTVISTRRGVPYWSSGAGRALVRWLDRSVTWFIANSRATRDRYCEEERLDPGRFDVIYNGLEQERFQGLSPDRRAGIRRDLQVGVDDPVVGIVANLRAVKGIADLVDATARLVPELPDLRVLVVGEGAERRPLEERIEDLGLEAHVRLLGARSDVPELLQVFDVGVLASHFESFSNSVLEYLAAGLPVVVTDVGGAREAVRDGHEGFVVPPGRPDLMAERLRELLLRPGGPRAFRDEAALDPRFGLDRMVRAHEDLYRRLAGHASRPSPGGRIETC